MRALSSPILHPPPIPPSHTTLHLPQQVRTPPCCSTLPQPTPGHTIYGSAAAPHSRIPTQRLPATHATPAQQPAYAYAYAKGRTESSRFSATHYATCHKQRQSPHTSGQRQTTATRSMTCSQYLLVQLVRFARLVRLSSFGWLSRFSSFSRSRFDRFGIFSRFSRFSRLSRLGNGLSSPQRTPQPPRPQQIPRIRRHPRTRPIRQTPQTLPDLPASPTPRRRAALRSQQFLQPQRAQ